MVESSRSRVGWEAGGACLERPLSLAGGSGRDGERGPPPLAEMARKMASLSIVDSIVVDAHFWATILESTRCYRHLPR